MRLTLLTLTALVAPTLAWATPDCGNPPVKTAELVHKIQTPEQVIAAPTHVEPTQAAPAIVAPIRVEDVPSQQTLTSQQTAPVKIAQVAEPAIAVATPASAYADILKRRISRGEAGLNLFDYAGAKAAGELETVIAYTDFLASQNPDTLSENDQIAYWANLYNALTVKLILENYPVKSIRKIKSGALSIGPWKRDAVTVNGTVLSLDTIEHKILRKRYADPAMVHYMVNCASIGCPNLIDKLWSGATLVADREQAARDFINSPRGVLVKGNKLKVSSIYNWFKKDFGGSKSSTLDHFRRFADSDLLTALDGGAVIDNYKYDWALNE